MSLHQVIYTSCMRGIDGVNDGQQIFSYDAGYPGAAEDAVKSLFSYQPPALGLGVVMTEELARTMPQSFTWRAMESGRYALALNTYLGRDYMGSSGRFGNFLSHVILLDRLDAAAYPCEYFGSPALRTSMRFEEVNSPDPPAPLPVPVLEPGGRVDIDAVQDFLNGECGGVSRMEIYKSMLRAMLSYEEERKRVVLCDSAENILLWIAALEYALPLENALDVNFTTYEYDPALSAAQICGVLEEGTRFSPESERLHFSFLLSQGRWPRLDTDGEFFDFIDTALSMSYESLQDFHRFLREGYSYRAADRNLCTAYDLYSLLIDGLSGVTREKLEGALAFAGQYASAAERVRAARVLLERREQLEALERESFLTAARFLLDNGAGSRPETKKDYCALLVNRVLRADRQEAEETFTAFYGEIEALAKSCGFSIATELVSEANWKKLAPSADAPVSLHKTRFFGHVLAMYVKDNNMEGSSLSKGSRMGEVFGNLVLTAGGHSEADAVSLACGLLDEFAERGDCLACLALNLYAVLSSLASGGGWSAQTGGTASGGAQPGGGWSGQTGGMASGGTQPGGGRSALWEHFQAAALSSADSDMVFSKLAALERYDWVFALFRRHLRQAESPRQAEEILRTHEDRLCRIYGRYYEKYWLPILEEYFSVLRQFDRQDVQTSLTALLRRLMEEKLAVPFGAELKDILLRDIPIQRPAPGHDRLIQDIYTYTYSVERVYPSGKLLLLCAGMELEDGRFDAKRKLTRICGLLPERPGASGCEPLDLTRFRQHEWNAFFAWIVPLLVKSCRNPDELRGFYRVFKMEEYQDAAFLQTCGTLYFEDMVNAKDPLRFMPFLEVLLEETGETVFRQVREDTVKQMRKYGRQKLEALDRRVNRAYQEDMGQKLADKRRATERWYEIYKAAAADNLVVSAVKSGMKSLMGVFGDRKKKTEAGPHTVQGAGGGPEGGADRNQKAGRK